MINIRTNDNIIEYQLCDADSYTGNDTIYVDNSTEYVIHLLENDKMHELQTVDQMLMVEIKLPCDTLYSSKETINKSYLLKELVKDNIIIIDEEKEVMLELLKYLRGEDNKLSDKRIDFYMNNDAPVTNTVINNFDYRTTSNSIFDRRFSKFIYSLPDFNVYFPQETNYGLNDKIHIKIENNIELFRNCYLVIQVDNFDSFKYEKNVLLYKIVKKISFNISDSVITKINPIGIYLSQQIFNDYKNGYDIFANIQNINDNYLILPLISFLDYTCYPVLSTLYNDMEFSVKLANKNILRNKKCNGNIRICVIAHTFKFNDINQINQYTQMGHEYLIKCNVDKKLSFKNYIIDYELNSFAYSKNITELIFAIKNKSNAPLEFSYYNKRTNETLDPLIDGSITFVSRDNTEKIFHINPTILKIYRERKGLNNNNNFIYILPFEYIYTNLLDGRAVQCHGKTNFTYKLKLNLNLRCSSGSAYLYFREHNVLRVMSGMAQKAYKN